MKKLTVDYTQGKTPPNHFDMKSFPILDRTPDSPNKLALAQSLYLPGGGVNSGVQPFETVYFVLDGEIQVTGEAGEHRVGAGEALLVLPGETRTVRNPGTEPARVLLIISVPEIPD